MGDATTTLSDLTVRDLTARLASRDPIPGGGSAAALAGAMAAALVSMVAELSVGRADAAEHEAEVLELAQTIAPIGNRNAASDAGVAAQLAAAAIRGALLNVRINLPYLPTDEPL